MHEITLLYFEDCTSWKVGLENLNIALEREQIEAKVTLVRVETPEEAQKERFLGSPSFRVDGADLWPEERTDYRLSCRVYATPEGMKGAPTVEMLHEKLRQMIKS